MMSVAKLIGSVSFVAMIASVAEMIVLKTMMGITSNPNP